MRLFCFFSSLAIALFLISCHSQKKVSYNYIVDINDTLAKNAVKNFEPVIQKNDLLSIQVYSNSTKPEISDVLYNPPALSGSSGSSSGGNGSTSNGGYMVDMDGNIRFPRLGIIHAEGLTKRQLADTIVSKITDLESPTAVVRFLNYRITVLGEVKNPTTFLIPNENPTIFDALGLAGDITIYGRRDNVMLIRSDADGKKEIVRLDLDKTSAISSPYFYLKPNDVLYVEPTEDRVAGTSEYRTRDVAIIASALSLAVVIVARLIQ